MAAEMPDILDAELVELSVTLTSQNPPYVVTRRHLFRSLQTTQELTFDTVVSIKSAKTDHDVNSFVDQAFENDAQKEAYLEELRSSDGGFANAAGMSMTQGASTSQIQSAPATDDGGVDTSGIPFIVGISIAGASAVGLIGLFIYSRRQGRRPPSGTTAVETSRSASARESYPFDAIKEADDDSLYDFNLEVPRRSSRDGASVFTSGSSVTMDYDDQVAFQKESVYASADMGGGVTESYTRRPSSAFYRYTVEAPPGLLGMVLESSVDGTPSVYGIKNTSPLAEEVRVGDLLVNVDGLDVSEMDATAVSRLIASKKKNKYRQLVFVRPQDFDQDPDD